MTASANQITIVRKGFWPWSKPVWTCLTAEESRTVAEWVALTDPTWTVDEVLRILVIASEGAYAADWVFTELRQRRLLAAAREAREKQERLTTAFRGAQTRNLDAELRTRG